MMQMPPKGTSPGGRGRPTHARRGAAFLLAATCLVMSGCTTSTDRSGAKKGPVRYAENGTFTMAAAEDWGKFDPYRGQIYDLSFLAYDSLVHMQPNGSFVSGLAEKWSADPRAARFTLRPNLTCSDGAALTATDVAAAINYVSDPKNKSMLYGLNTPTVPLTASGDNAARSVDVVVRKPFGFLLQTIGRLPIVCAKGLKNPKLLESASDGTGPFVLTDVAPGRSYSFRVRKDYAWGPGGAKTTEPGTPARVVLRIIGNETTAANLLLSGELNLARISGEDRQRLAARGLESLTASEPGDWLWFNQIGDRETADPRVRQALVHAVDMTQAIKVNAGATGRAATGLAPVEPRACAGNAVAGQLPGHDATAAQTLLDKAGWTRGADGFRRKAGAPLTFDLLYVPALSVYEKPTAELLAQQWSGVGVKVNLVAGTRADFTKALYETSNYDILLAGGGFSLPSQAVKYLSGPIPPDGTNVAGIENSEYNRLVAKAEAMTPPDACIYWDQAERALYHNADVVPISNRTQYWFLRKGQAQARSFNAPVPTSLRVLQ
jgi:peptide/nickel transport system substrate-binding protein